jgi:peptidoglycan/xylan/chitin deacetylase (PgdA/CDA1 family)
MGVPAGTYNNPTFTPSLPAGTTGSVTVNANRSGTLTIATNASTPPRVTAHTITLNGVTSLPFDLRVDGISGVLSPGEYTFPVPPPVLNITMGQWDDVTTPDLTAAILKDSYRLEVAVSAQIPAGVALYMCTPDDEWSTNEILGVFENGKYIWEFTPSKMAEFTSSPFSFRFRIGRAGVQFNDLGIQSIKLFFTDKKITVGAQNGTLTAGIPGFVTYPVTTENIPNGTYSAAVRNLPFGMGIMFGSVTINNNSGTLTLQTGTAARAIIRNNLALVIDGITSTNFGIAIAAANYGDIDGDGKIDAADITLLRRYVAANDKELFLEQNPRFNLINADVTGNNNIGAADVARLRQYVAGYDVALGKPVEVEDWQYLIALTFDDGPNNDTITILDKFEELGAVGSFFVNAGLINAGNIPTLQRAVALGNDIENHGMTHTDMNTMSASAIIAEINQAADVIEAAVGIRSRYFRPPFFGIGNHMIGADVTTNHPFIFSNLDTKDYENTSAHIINFMLTNAADGAADGGIVLFHDNPQTAASLEHFIPQMKAMGYKFVTVRELYEMRAATPTWYTGGAWPNTHVK